MRAAPRGLRWLGFAAGAALLVAACGWLANRGAPAQTKLSEGSTQVAYRAGLGAHASALPVALKIGTSPSRAACAGATRRLGSARVAYAGLVVKNRTLVHSLPHSGTPVVATLSRYNVNGFRQVLGVVGVHTGSGCRADWYRVQLPVVPNGSFGWIRAWAVSTYRVRSRIVVDLSQRELRVYRFGKLRLRTPVAVGTTATPTPRGRFFVDERYTLPDGSGPFGPNALGISAHSDALQHVWVEDGPIGIHGTNEPWSIGRAASHGCIRVPNDVMTRVFRLAPAGTPIIVTA